MLRLITNGAIAALAALALSGLSAMTAVAQPAGVRAENHAELGAAVTLPIASFMFRV